MNEENGLPKGWVWTRVGDIYDIVGGGTPSTDIEEYWNGDIAWISSADIYGLKDIRPRKRITKAAIENSATNLVPEGSLIVVTRVGLGKVALTELPLCFSQDSQALISASPSIHPDYSLYYLAQAVQVFKYQSRGTTIAGVTKKQLSELPFPLPPLPEQQRIVAAIEQQFSRLDAGVAALRKAQAKLKRYRAAVLKAAVEGKLTEEWRAEHSTTEPASKLLKRILAERRAKWEADLRAKGKDPAKVKYVEPAKPNVESLPELPEGWCWATVEQLAAAEPNSLIDGPFGSNLKTEHYRNEGGRVIRLQNIGDGEFKDEKAYIALEHLETLRKHRVFVGDLVIAALGENPPRSCIIPELVGPAIVKADCIRFKVSANILNTFVNIALNAEPTRRRTTSQLHGIGRPRLNLTEIRSIVIPLPPFAEQEQIIAEVERRLSIVSQLEATVEANLKRAERLRQSILKEAFAGRLVPQDPNDEPASVLLERIRKERDGRKQGMVNNGRAVDVAVTEAVKIDVKETRQVGLWESVGGGE